MRYVILGTSIFAMFLSKNAIAQNCITLEDVLHLAKEYSMEYRESKNSFLFDYFAYRQYKIGLLPKISFNATPLTINRSISERYDYENNVEAYRESKTLSSNSALSLSQKVPFTGGSLTLSSNLSRIENLGDAPLTSYSTSPILVSFSQPLFAHNAYRWEKLELPVKLKLGKLKLLQAEQELNIRGTQLFFQLLKAFQMYELAQQEVCNSDTLLGTGKTQIKLNIITPDQLVELELRSANARVVRAKNEQALNDARYELNQFIGGHLPANTNPVSFDEFSLTNLNSEDALTMAQNFNPFYLEIEQEKIELDRNLDQAKKQTGFSANLNVSFGLNQGGKTLKEAFGKPLNQQSGAVSLSFPILNWGENKDKLILARVKYETDEQKIQMRIADFEQNVYKQVAGYNLSKETVSHARKAKELALKAYQVKKQQFRLAQITLAELNQSLADMLRAREEYIGNISQCRVNLYELQRTTLYNLETKLPLTTDFEQLFKLFNH